MRASTVFDQAILSTVAYSAVFSAPILEKKLYKWLHTDHPISDIKLRKRVAILKKRKVLLLQDGLVTFSGHGAWVKSAKRKRIISQGKLAILIENLSLITWIPWIQGVAVTGSVAVGNAEGRDDVDLMIVSDAKRLWITRLCALIILALSGRLRYGRSHRVESKWCLNLWLDSSALTIRTQNLYTAREIVQVYWIYDSLEVMSQFLVHNLWIKRFLANLKIPKQKNGKCVSPQNSRTFDAIDWIAFKLQKLYMSRHHTTEYIDRHRAFFHPRNTQKKVLKRYTKLCNFHIPHT